MSKKNNKINSMVREVWCFLLIWSTSCCRYPEGGISADWLLLSCSSSLPAALLSCFCSVGLVLLATYTSHKNACTHTFLTWLTHQLNWSVAFGCISCLLPWPTSQFVTQLMYSLTSCSLYVVHTGLSVSSAMSHCPLPLIYFKTKHFSQKSSTKQRQ